MTSNGADIKTAIAHLRKAGITITDLARDLDVHSSTAYRWAAGSRRPSVANFAALRDLVDGWYSRHVHRRCDRQHVAALEAACDALRTVEERAKAERLAADAAAFLAERARQRAVEQEQQDAEIRKTRDEVLGRSYRSITRDVDPFALVGAEPMEVAL